MSAVADAVGNLSCTGVSWDSIQLSWELPDNPNGQILFYEILVATDLQSHTHQAHTPEYTVTGLSPDQKYALTVAAVNSAGPGDAVNCTASTQSESGSRSYCSVLRHLHIQVTDPGEATPSVLIELLI